MPTNGKARQVLWVCYLDQLQKIFLKHLKTIRLQVQSNDFRMFLLHMPENIPTLLLYSPQIDASKSLAGERVSASTWLHHRMWCKKSAVATTRRYRRLCMHAAYMFYNLVIYIYNNNNNNNIKLQYLYIYMLYYMYNTYFDC